MDGERAYPLSFGQQGRFDLDRELSERGIPVPNWYLMKAYRILGPLDAEALERSFADLVRAHDALATRFEHDGTEFRQVVARDWDFYLEVVDLSEETRDAERRVQELVRDLAEEALDPHRRTQLQALLFRIEPSEHILVVSVDHLVYDVYSEAVLLEDLSSSYRRETGTELDGASTTQPLQFP